MTIPVSFVGSGDIPQEFFALKDAYDFVLTRSAADALVKLSESFQILIVDVHHPLSDMGMTDFIRTVHHRDPFLPVLLAVKGFGAEHVLQRVVSYLKCGAQQFIQLPASPFELSWMLSHVIEQRQMSHAVLDPVKNRFREPKWQQWREQFVLYMDRKRERGLPLNSEELKVLLGPLPLQDSEKNQMLAQLHDPFLVTKDSQKSFTVLIVEDEFLNRRQLVELFFPYFNCLEAEDGQEALELVERRKVDVVLLDVRLPGMTGDELIPHILKHSPEASIVMVTGNPEFELVASSIRQGASDYILKPYNRQYLKNVVCHLLQHKIFKKVLSEQSATQLESAA